MPTIKCCKNCVPPKRQPGCHATCKDYIKEEAEWKEIKRKIKDNQKKTPRLTSYDFDEIAYVSSKRHKRRARD